jgi:hypothetical protein
VVPGEEVLTEALEDGLAGLLGGEWETDDYREGEVMAAVELEAHYSDDTWTWRA